MTRQHQFSCTMLPNSAGTLPTMNLSCVMANIEPVAQTDYLRDIADNILFVLGAYFFAFFPWAIMHNIDFISEKWRTCRRTRNLARMHVAGSVLPIIYVGVYAEAQRRAGENTEFGAALAALMFNVFQLLRTIMGIVQLNAFVAWCKDAMECMRALLGDDDWGDGTDMGSSAEMSEQEVDSSAQSGERRHLDETRKYCGLSKLEVLVKWCKRAMGRTGDLLSGNTENRDQGEDIEKWMRVNNMVVDNELGGREVTVLPSWKKMMEGMKKGRFEPSKWLRTDRVMLNTVRWCGALLCSNGGLWGVDKYGSAKDGEMLEKFFSGEIYNMRFILASTEWKLDSGNGGPEHFSVMQIDGYGGFKLTGEMSTAYGTGFNRYWGSETWDVDSYSFEFNSLVSSYPADESRSGNREKVTVGLAHSLVLAKHVGVEKLKAIRQYYDLYSISLGSIREVAFKLLQRQSGSCRITEDSDFWEMFGGICSEIPLFPYRMQAVALWGDATNWRVLQASAHRDILNSVVYGDLVDVGDDEVALHDSVHEVNIFEYSANWSKKRVEGQGSLGVVIETVRTFLAEWIAESEVEPNWEPEIPKNCIEFDRIKTISVKRTDHRDYLVWVCQRELQKNLANMGNKCPNFAGNTELIMLFLLGFPFLRIDEAQDSGFGPNESQEALDANAASSANTHSSIDLSVQLWRAWTPLAPHNISLIIRVDVANCTVGLKLRNDGGNGRFKWQEWVNAAIGCLKGNEDDDKLGFGRTIMKVDLGKQMVEVSPLLVNEYVIEPAVETSTAKIWMGWLPFDVRICKFEFDQWCGACNINLNGAMGLTERVRAEEEIRQFEGVMESVIAEKNAEVESSAEGAED